MYTTRHASYRVKPTYRAIISLRTFLAGCLSKAILEPSFTTHLTNIITFAGLEKTCKLKTEKFVLTTC